jgi:hypothetical protein
VIGALKVQFLDDFGKRVPHSLQQLSQMKVPVINFLPIEGYLAFEIMMLLWQS